MQSIFFSRFDGKWMFLITLSLLILCGCSGCKSFETDVDDYQITLFSTPEANVNKYKKSVPLRVKVFNLRSNAKFMSSDFFTLNNNVSTVLGEQLLSSEQLFLLPGGEKVNVSGSKGTGCYYIGVVGDFQNFNDKTWRIVIPIANNGGAFYKFWHHQNLSLEIVIIADGQGLHVTKK